MIDQDENSEYDIAIIGAGIQGVGIAQSAAANGWRVAVIERLASPGLGTSSRSSKLIHGGLRYLETFQFKLVYECLKERRLLIKNAPSLVQLQKFYLPVYQSSQRSSLWIRLGLSLYTFLSGLGEGSGHRKLSPEEWKDLDGLTTANLKAVFQYYDGQTDDSALSQAVAASAKNLGVEFFFDEELQSAEAEGQCYQLSLASGKKIKCRALINVAGPWANDLAKKIAPEVPVNQTDLVKGSHLILDIEDISRHYYLESPDDGRAFFVLPWKGKIMVGTTEKKLASMPTDVDADEDEIDYLLRGFNHYFPAYQCDKSKIIRSFAGVRVLPGGDDEKSANKKNRETLFLMNKQFPLYCAVYGGKLTSYRATSEKVTEKIKPFLPQRQKIADTASLSLEISNDQDTVPIKSGL